MWICYVDEAGDLGSLADPPRRNDQPVFVLGGIFLPASAVRPITKEYICLLRTYYPSKYRRGRRLDSITDPIKGADLRRQFLREGRNKQRHAIRVLDHVIRTLEKYEARIVFRIWIKSPGERQRPCSLYAFSLQDVCDSFNRFLSSEDSHGIVLADARFKKENVSASHSVFTRMHAKGRNHLRNLIESPSFGHSENHARLQICDLIASAYLFPVACAVYHHGLSGNIHVCSRASRLREHFGARIKALQYRYQESSGRWRGGITVSDPVGRRSSRLIFAP